MREAIKYVENRDVLHIVKIEKKSKCDEKFAEFINSMAQKGVIERKSFLRELLKDFKTDFEKAKEDTLEDVGGAARQTSEDIDRFLNLFFGFRGERGKK